MKYAKRVIIILSVLLLTPVLCLALNDADAGTSDSLFNQAVQNIWPDDVISSRAGKYPDITVYESGSPGSIRLKSQKKILELLKEVDVIRDKTGWTFTDLFIRIHTDLIDIYGNERVDEVITIKFTPETLDKINYQNVLVKNIPLIADVWREHPALNK